MYYFNIILHVHDGRFNIYANDALAVSFFPSRLENMSRKHV